MHRLGNGCERGEPLATMLDHVLPPPLGVGFAGIGNPLPIGLGASVIDTFAYRIMEQ